MTNSTQLITYTTLSYIHYGLYFIYLRCILFLNTIDHIIFSNMLEDNNNNTNNTNNTNTNNTNTNNNNFNSYHKNSFNSISRHNDTHYSIFDVNKTNLLNSHTKKQIDDMEETLFSDY